MNPDEHGFEDAITDSLVEAGGYRLCKWGAKPEWAAVFDKRTLGNLHSQRPTWLANAHANLDAAVVTSLARGRPTLA